MITKYIYKVLVGGFYSPNRVVVTGGSSGRQRDIVHRGAEVEKMGIDGLKLKRWGNRQVYIDRWEQAS